jgi:hypothetical protein
MTHRVTVGSCKAAERSPAAALQEAVTARIALGEALQGIVRLLDLLRENDNVEQRYWDLCDENERALSLAELPPDLRAAWALRQKQKAELRALFASYHEAEHRWCAARRELIDQIRRVDG